MPTYAGVWWSCSCIEGKYRCIQPKSVPSTGAPNTFYFEGIVVVVEPEMVTLIHLVILRCFCPRTPRPVQPYSSTFSLRKHNAALAHGGLATLVGRQNNTRQDSRCKIYSSIELEICSETTSTTMIMMLTYRVN